MSTRDVNRSASRVLSGADQATTEDHHSAALYLAAYQERWPDWKQAFRETYGTRHRKTTEARTESARVQGASLRQGKSR